MAHDRMKNDDLDRNMGRAGQDDDLGSGQDFGQKTPGRNPQDQQTGQKGAGQKNQPGGGQEDFGKGDFGKGGGAGQGGNNPGQNR